MPDLRCPICGTPVPDTGMRSAGGTFAPDVEPTFSPGEWKQHGRCPSCGKALVRNPQCPEAPQLEKWRLPRPLMHLGGTAIMRSTDMPPGSGRVIEGSAHLSASGTLSAGGSVEREVGIRRTEWEASLTSFGMAAGAVVSGKPGAIIGGVAAYGVARWRWRH